MSLGVRDERHVAQQVIPLLARRLAVGAPLREGDLAALSSLSFSLRQLGRDTPLVHAGQAPTELHMMVSGVAGRASMTRAGHRQMLAFLLPGDLFDWSLFQMNATSPAREKGVLDHSIVALSPCTVASFEARAFARLLGERPAIARGAAAYGVVEQEISREWMIGMGSRPAAERVAHLICELFARMEAMGLTQANSCSLPLTQAHISESQGLTVVHTNRVLQRMRSEGLIAMGSRMLTILDPARLRQFADFSPAYLSPR